jgi:hypothetical protein
MNGFDRRASGLADRSMRTEAAEGAQYDDDTVRRSIVHAREDIILLVSHLSSLNSQIQQLRWALFATLGALGLATFNQVMRRACRNEGRTRPHLSSVRALT